MEETSRRTSDSASGLVSVVLPVHNGMPFLPQSIESLLNQNYADIEIIVVDDGSTDGTVEYLRSVSDSRMRVLRQDSRSGVVAALNRGLAEAQGQFIARQDADDLSMPTRIEREVRFMISSPTVDIVATCAEFIDENGLPLQSSWIRQVRRLHDPATSPEAIRRLLPLTCCLIHGSILTRRKALVEARGYRLDFEWAEDYDLWLRLLPNHKFAKLPDRLYAYRVHGSQVSASRRREQVRNVIRAKLAYLRRTRPDLPATVRTVIQGCNLGSDLYRESLQEFGMVEAAPPESLDLLSDKIEGDLLIVTDFNSLDQFKTKLSSTRPAWSQEGNFFLGPNA